jgi:hypothetical protein
MNYNQAQKQQYDEQKNIKYKLRKRQIIFNKNSKKMKDGQMYIMKRTECGPIKTNSNQIN